MPVSVAFWRKRSRLRSPREYAESPVLCRKDGLVEAAPHMRTMFSPSEKHIEITRTHLGWVFDRQRSTVPALSDKPLDLASRGNGIADNLAI
jgi:hypothetical protein